ncbi:MAG: hypothetical protein GY703_21590 [Gammaproteobacteria bacterium]|nr:hypothetical protein [Gammaproteobacteria bacterium]
MKRKHVGWAVLLLALILMAAGLSASHAGEEFVVTGVDWTQSSEQAKRGFLAGIVTMIEIERELQAKGPGCSKSSIPTLHDGLSSMTLLEMRESIDRYYADNPGKIETPVIHILWDMANAQ